MVSPFLVWLSGWLLPLIGFLVGDLNGAGGGHRARVGIHIDRGGDVFVSYKWETDSETVVDLLQAALEDAGIGVVRDKSDIAYRDSVRGFMDRLAQGRAIHSCG